MSHGAEYVSSKYCFLCEMQICAIDAEPMQAMRQIKSQTWCSLNVTHNSEIAEHRSPKWGHSALVFYVCAFLLCVEIMLISLEQ